MKRKIYMGWWRLFWWNLTHSEREQLIRCQHCRKLQKMPYDWDYMRCERCRGYIYDER